MKLDSLHKLYVHELKNLYSGETQSLSMLSELLNQVSGTSLRQALEQQQEITQRQIKRIEQIFDQLEFSPVGQKNQAVAGLLTETSKAIDNARNHQVRDQTIATSWQRLQRYLCTSYELARDYAEKLERRADIEYFNATLNEKNNANVDLADIGEQTQQQLQGSGDRTPMSHWRSLMKTTRSALSGLPLRKITKIALAVFGLTAILATVLSMLPLPAWWVRIFDFPRGQIALVAGVVLGAYLFLIRWRWWPDLVFSIVLAASITYQAYQIYPYTMIASYQVKPGVSADLENRFQLMVANLLMDNRNVDGLLKLVADTDPDLLLLLEPNQWWINQIEPLQQRYSFTKLYPLENSYGMALYSRLPLIEPQVNFLIQDDVPSIDTRFKLPAGTEIELHALHPRPPSPTEHYRSTERDAELLLIGEKVKDSSYPVVVAGDMNDVAWSRTTKRFQRISQLLDPRIGRGIFPTFHAEYVSLRWPLDHVFFSDELRFVEMEILDYFGSDHFPISITLSYEPEIDEAQKDPENADSEDHEEASETIEKAKRAN